MEDICRVRKGGGRIDHTQSRKQVLKQWPNDKNPGRMTNVSVAPLTSGSPKNWECKGSKFFSNASTFWWWENEELQCKLCGLPPPRPFENMVLCLPHSASAGPWSYKLFGAFQSEMLTSVLLPLSAPYGDPYLALSIGLFIYFFGKCTKPKYTILSFDKWKYLVWSKYLSK